MAELSGREEQGEQFWLWEADEDLTSHSFIHRRYQQSLESTLDPH